MSNRECESIDLTDDAFIEEQTAIYERWESEQRDANYAKKLARGSKRQNDADDDIIDNDESVEMRGLKRAVLSDSDDVIDLTAEIEEEDRFSKQHARTKQDEMFVKAFSVKELLERSKKRSNENTHKLDVKSPVSVSDVEITSSSMNPSIESRKSMRIDSDDDVTITASNIRQRNGPPPNQPEQPDLVMTDYRVNLPAFPKKAVPATPAPTHPQIVNQRLARTPEATALEYANAMERIKVQQAAIREYQAKPGIMAPSPSRLAAVQKQNEAYQKRVEQARFAPVDPMASYNAFVAQKDKNQKERELQLNHMHKGLAREFGPDGNEVLAGMSAVNPFGIPVAKHPVTYYNAFGNSNPVMDGPTAPGAINEMFTTFEPDISAQQAKEDLENLLANVNSYGDALKPEERIQTPEQMTIVLMEHQKLGVEWMFKMEQGSNKGGILADDMVRNCHDSFMSQGLGKTIQSIALMCKNMPAKNQKKPTLIIAPLSLVDQDKTVPGTFKVLKYHSNRTQSIAMLQNYDIILTTYGIMSTECPIDEAKLKKKAKAKKNKLLKKAKMDSLINGLPFIDNDDSEDSDDGFLRNERRMQGGALFKVNFHRVVLDEAHIIKNRNTKASLSCQYLKSEHRWCLTGTPIQNDIVDIYGLIRFLDIKPYNDWDHFAQNITKPFKNRRKTSAIRRVKLILEALCLRRTKEYKLDGKPIIQLLPKTVLEDKAVFTGPEHDFYQALFSKARVQFNIYLKQGTVMKNYSNVLAWLLRLRQAWFAYFFIKLLGSCHPSLVTTAGVSDPADDISNKPEGITWEGELEKMSNATVNRLLESNIAETECLICWDVLNAGVIIPACGHVYCRECIMQLILGKEVYEHQCPQCRGPILVNALVPVAGFLKKHGPVVEEIEEAVPVFDIKEEEVVSLTQDSEDLLDIDESLLSHSFAKRLVKAHKDIDKKTSAKSYKKSWISSSKIDKMLEKLQDIRNEGNGEKTIIFSQFTSFLDLLEVPLIENGLKFTRYDGNMHMNERSDAIQKLKDDPDCNVMIVSLKCGSLGLNLVCANHVILLDVWWNPSVESQAIDRTHRIGQTRKVTVHRITVANTVEDRIIELQRQEIMDAALGDGQMSRGAGLNLGDLMRLFEVDELDKD